MQDLHSQFRMEFHFDLPPHPPLRHSVALSPWESVSRNFQSPMAPYKFRSLATPKGQCYLVKEQAEEDQQN